MSTVEIRRLEALQQVGAGQITQQEAAARLGLSHRQLKRLWRAYKQAGAQGLISKRRGRAPNNRVDPGLLARAIAKVQAEYADFGPTLAAETLAERDGIFVRRETLRKAMIAAFIWIPHRKKRVQIHGPRERRLQFGELIQGDGSPHKWFEERGPRCSLLILIDDATSQLLAAHFAPSETTDAYFTLMDQYLKQWGKPLSLYVDKHSVFRTTRYARSAEEPTQFSRALNELDIELICANSPQAKGRVERANRTLQDRLVKDLRLHRISSIEDANLHLPLFIEQHNKRFATAPRSAIDAHRPLTEDLSRILCHVEERTVGRDLVVQYNHQLYQIIAPNGERRMKHAKVLVRKTKDALLIEHLGKSLQFEPLGERFRQPPIIDAKDLQGRDQSATWRVGDAQPPTHPWKSLPPKDPGILRDISAWRAGDVIVQR